MIKERRNPYSFDRGATNPPIFESAKQPAQQALDKKAENARELGLDYEPPLSEKEFLEAEIKRLEHNEEVLMNALFKACGDDAQVVEATIESQGELK